MKKMSEVYIIGPDGYTGDGVGHINISLTGATRLGRLLSPLADIAVEHPQYGTFRTVEGLRQYLLGDKRDETYRALHGTAVLKRCSSFAEPAVWVSNFDLIMREAHLLKIRSHPELMDLLLKNTLPFNSYRMVKRSGDQYTTLYLPGAKQLTAAITSIAAELKNRAAQ